MKKYFIGLLTILLFMQCKQEAPFQDLKKEWNSITPQQYIEQTSYLINRSWGKSSTIWEGFNLAQYQAVINIQKEAYILNYDENVKEVDPKSLPKDFQYHGRDDFYLAPEQEYLGKKTMYCEFEYDRFSKPYMKIEKEAMPKNTSLFSTLNHETFHHFQDSWNIPAVDQEAIYKFDNPMARRYRIEMMLALKNAIFYPKEQQKYLSAAAYWFDKYRTEFNEEYTAIRGMDILEGSAKYFETAILVRAEIGFDASKEDIFNAYKALLTYDDVIEWYADGLPDTESYLLGNLAGIIFEDMGNNSWKKEVMNGKTPLEVLLNPITPTPQKLSPELDAHWNKIKNGFNGDK